MSWIIVVLGIYLLITLVFVFFTINNLGAKRPTDFSDFHYMTPWELKVPYEDIEFYTEDNHRLQGWLMVPQSSPLPAPDMTATVTAKSTSPDAIRKDEDGAETIAAAAEMAGAGETGSGSPAEHDPNSNFNPNSHPSSSQKEKAKVVVIFCGRFGRKQDYLGISSGLVRQGLHVFIFDYRGRKRLDKTRVSVGHFERLDSQAAVLQLKRVFHRHGVQFSLGLLGYSLGGHLALVCAEKNEEVRAVVSDCGFGSLLGTIAFRYRQLYYWPPHLALWLVRYGIRLWYGYRVAAIESYSAIRNIGKRAAFYWIHNQKDKSVPVSHARRMFHLAAGVKQLDIIDEGVHCSSYFHDREGYIQKVGNFFCHHLT